VDFGGSYMKFPHMNSIVIDDDGNIVLSSRNSGEVTKINRQTGDIIWRLGGPVNEFTFVNDPFGGFCCQHDIKALGKGHYTVFDNGNGARSVSRAVEYVVNPNTMTARMIWEYRNPPGTSYSFYMGNVQRLPSGNTLINWAIGDRPKATEVTPDGQVVYEMNFANYDYHCYRTFRFPWDGMALKPTLYAEALSDRVALIFNKFGDPDISYYKIYGGQSSRPTTVLDTSRATLKNLTDLENGTKYFFRVTAVNKNGVESPFSNEKNVTVNYLDPRQNMVRNGNFLHFKDSWTFELQDDGAAEWLVDQGISSFLIANGGINIYDIQLRQNGMILMKGNYYLFEFDAWADANNRLIIAKVGQDGGDYINYSKLGESVLNKAHKHYSYTFKMEDETDDNARVVFNVGQSSVPVSIDNVSLKMVDGDAVKNHSADVPYKFDVKANYPNPFNSRTTIQFSIPAAGSVTIEIYNILGERTKQIDNGWTLKGEHQIVFDAQDLSSGIYFFKVRLKQPDDSQTCSAVQKMILIK
jgi:hypothetical protein